MNNEIASNFRYITLVFIVKSFRTSLILLFRYMVIRVFLVVILSFLLTFLAFSQVVSTERPAEKVIIGYVTSWSSEVPDPTYLTHINYAFGHVNST